MRYKLKRLLTRPRAVVRSIRKLGLWPTLHLVRIRLGSSRRLHEVRVPQWPHGVHVRGGRSSDTTVLYEILVTGEYAFIDGLTAPDWIIDGGANVGLAALYFLNRYPTSRVIALEPYPESACVCRRNLEPYGDRAQVIEAAVWSEDGVVHLDPQWEELVNRVRAASGAGGGSARAVGMRSLLSLTGGPVDLLKLDVEGSEEEIFGSGSAAWLPMVRNIVIELHGPQCEERFFAAVRPYQYQMSRSDNVCFLRDLRPKTMRLEA